MGCYSSICVNININIIMQYVIAPDDERIFFVSL